MAPKTCNLIPRYQLAQIFVWNSKTLGYARPTMTLKFNDTPHMTDAYRTSHVYIFLLSASTFVIGVLVEHFETTCFSMYGCQQRVHFRVFKFA